MESAQSTMSSRSKIQAVVQRKGRGQEKSAAVIVGIGFRSSSVAYVRINDGAEPQETHHAQPRIRASK